MLLTKFAARSYEELRTVSGVLHDTYQQAARALGLATGDQEYLDALDEASAFLTGAGLRHLFTSIIVGEEKPPVRYIWDERHELLAEDYLHRDPSNLPAALNSALIHISRLLQLHGRTLEIEGISSSYVFLESSLSCME
jgi:hypothetical protein